MRLPEDGAAMIWLLCCYVGMYIYRPWEVFPALGAIQAERIYMVGVIGFWAIWPEKKFRFSLVHLTQVLFALVVGISWMISPYRDVPTTQELVENHLKILIFYVILVTSVRNENDLRLLLLAYVVAMTIYAGHSLREYLCGRYEYRQGFQRLVGVDVTSQQSNIFASQIVSALPLAAVWWRQTRSVLVRGGLVGFFGLIGVCVALTGSRGGYVILAAFALMQACLSKHRKMALGLLIVLGIGVSLAMPDFVINRFMTLIDPSAGPANAQHSAMGRIVGLMAGLRVWQENLLLGAGPNSFILAAGLGFQAHNLLGQVLAELGTAGLIAFLCILLCCVWNSFRIRRQLRSRPELKETLPYRVLLATLVMLMLQLIYGVGAHNLYRFQWYWTAGFNVVATMCLRQRLQQPAPVTTVLLAATRSRGAAQRSAWARRAPLRLVSPHRQVGEGRG